MVQVLSNAQQPDRPARSYLAAGFVGLAAAFLLAGYELVRSPANSLFVEAYGKGALPYVMAATPIGVVAMLYVYGRLLSWLGARRTMLVTTIGSCLVLAGIFAAIEFGGKPWTFSRAILYVFREAYVVLLVEQYWSFINSTLATGTAKKLNGPICGIASAGAITGGYVVSVLSAQWGTPRLLLGAAAITLPAALFMDLAYRWCGEPKDLTSRRSDTLGLRLFGSNRMLAILLGVILLTQAVAALLDLNFQGILADAIPNLDKRTAYSGRFFMSVNMVSFGMQFIATPVLLRLVPLAMIHVAIPLVHVATCAYLLQSPSLFAAGMAYTIFKAVDYSTFRAAKEILYIPLSFDARYRAKEVIDVFGYRFGKGGTSLVVSGLAVLNVALTGTRLALGALVAAAAWSTLAVPLVRAYTARQRASTDASPAPQITQASAEP